MSVVFPVAEMMERVRIRCGLSAYTTESNITTAMVLTMFQESARDLSNIMGELDWYFVTTSPLVTIANNPLVALPANFASLHRLVWLKSSTEIVSIEEANLEDVRPAMSSESWPSVNPKRRITGQSLEFFPTPTGVYNLELRYSTGAFIATAGDNFVGHLGWDTWLVYNVCSIVCERQEKDSSAFDMKRDRKQVDIMRAAGRDKTAITQPRDVRGRGAYDPTDPWERF